MLDDTTLRCRQVVASLQAVQLYFQTIQSADDFLNGADGQLRFDAIIMRLQVVGENVKRIAESQPDFFITKLHLDLTDVIRFRDFISHHYEKVDHEIIYDICVWRIPELQEKFERYLIEVASK